MIFYTLKDGYTTDPISIKEVMFLGINIWSSDENQSETFYLYKVYVEMRIKNYKHPYHVNIVSSLNTFYDINKKRYYSFLYSHEAEYVHSALRSKDKDQILLILTYLFRDTLIEIPEKSYSFDRLYLQTRRYVNYMRPIKRVGDVFKDEEFGPDSYLFYIKKKLKRMFGLKYVILENFDAVLDDNFLSQPSKFKLHYFESLSSCFKNFKAFVNFLNILKCSKEDSLTIDDNVFKVSHLEQYLREKINNDFKNINDADLRTQQIYEQVELLFKKCFDEIIKNLQKNYIILLVRGSFTKEYYFDEFYRFIKKETTEMIKDIDENHKESVPNICDIYFEKFETQIGNMDRTNIDKSWESLKISDYFSNLIGKEIKDVEDYIEVDKILCDFNGIVNSAYCLKKEMCYNQPDWHDNLMLIDNFDCQIVGGIEVVLQNPVQFGGIKAFDSTGKKITMERNCDFFVRVHTIKCKVSLTFERIRERDIQEIEVISVDKKYRKRFNVSEYLDKYD